jgi:hypothetical protein
MAAATGFWSYVHDDDEAEGGRVRRIAADLEAQYGVITGETIRIFVDRADIEWGDEWRKVVDRALAGISFFMPVLTPRYFASQECRREFNTFARRATQLGVRELVMPILYVRFPALDADPPTDELVELAKSFQWEDWTALRFAALESPEYRSAIATMAERLSRAGLTAENVDSAAVLDNADDDDLPGFFDRMAKTEVALKEWVQTLNALQPPIMVVGEVAALAGERTKAADARGAGIAGRLEVFSQLAVDLDPAAIEIQELAHSFTSQMNDVDSGMRAILEQAAAEIDEDSRGDLLRQLAEFGVEITTLATAADTGLGALEQMVTAIASVENQSRNLRPVLRTLRQGLSMLLDGREVINGWAANIEDFLRTHR